MGLFNKNKKGKQNMQTENSVDSTNEKDIIEEFRKRWEERISKASLSEKEELLKQYEKEASELNRALWRSNMEVREEQLKRGEAMIREKRAELRSMLQEIDRKSRYMEGRLEELRNAPGAVKARQVATKQATETMSYFKKMQEDRFTKEYENYYYRLSRVLNENGTNIYDFLFKDMDSQLKSKMEDIRRNILKEKGINIELKDFLIPFLIIKKNMDIITPEEESILKDILIIYQGRNNDFILVVNSVINGIGILFGKDNQVDKDIIEKLEQGVKSNIERLKAIEQTKKKGSGSNSFKYDGSPRGYTGVVGNSQTPKRK